MLDAIVVGSGAAGVAAAYGLQGTDVLVLDVGKRPPDERWLEGNLFDARRNTVDLFDQLIGREFESLRNLRPPKVSLKLKAPHMSFIIEDWEKLSPLRSANFDAVMSFAQGGLANAWGAGVYRFNDRDLKGFPVRAAELAPYYDELTRLIGISGAGDDLSAHFGPTGDLQEPLKLSSFYEELLAGYEAKRDAFRRESIHVGRPRLAVLTREHDGRPAYAYENTEFFRPWNRAIYNPAFTLERLIEQGAAKYLPGMLVHRYRELEDRVEVQARELSTGALHTFQARNLFLAAGSLNSAKIVLQSNDDTSTRLPVLDNPMSCIPLFRWTRIGDALDTSASAMAQLNLVYDGSLVDEPVQGSLYCTTGPLRSDVLFDFPLPVSAGLLWAKYLASAMGLLMVFYPGRRSDRNYLQLAADGSLNVTFERETLGDVEGVLIRAFRRIGFVGFKSLCQYNNAGASLHYAGHLPMRSEPGPYETDALGRVHGTRRVYVTDGAAFSTLPAKNLTFTIMANSLRISRHAVSRIR